MTETSREHWIRVFTAHAMQALIGKSDILPDRPVNADRIAQQAVEIAKRTLDEIDARREEWAHQKYPR